VTGPFVSVVVPTRDRPNLLRYCLKSLALQTFKNLEVIVSDNHTGKPCRGVFDEVADDRFRYVTPPSPLAMHDSWEHACSFAAGEYVALLTDKTVLRPSALQIMHKALEEKPAEIVSWWNEEYVPAAEERGYDRGRYLQLPQRPRLPYYYEPSGELVRRFSLNVRRGTEGVHYYWGKICFGAYHRNLIRRIRESIGRLFHPACPDYTSMIAALAHAKGAMDIGQPLLISFRTRDSTGRQTEELDDFALNWVKTYDPSLQTLEALPLKGLYTSLHNLVAADYNSMREKIGRPIQDMNLNKINLILRAKEDLDRRAAWQDESRRKEQYDVWNRCLSKLSFHERVSFYRHMYKTRLFDVKSKILLYTNGFVARRIRWLGILPGFRSSMIPYYRWRLAYDSPSRTFDNILEAAKYGDEYYKAILPLAN